MKVEFWVVRVLMHQGPRNGPMRIGDNTRSVPGSVMAKVVSGDLACVPPDNVIAEPVQWFPNEEEAREYQRRRSVDDPSNEYRVVLNADGV